MQVSVWFIYRVWLIKKGRKGERQITTVHNSIFKSALKEYQLGGKGAWMEFGSLKGCDWRANDSLMILLASFLLPITQKLGTLDHSLTVTDVQWPTFNVMNCIVYLHTVSSSILVFERLRSSWISFCTKGFSELLQLTVSSQCLPVVITWWHLKYSTAVFVCAGVWRL